MPTWWLAAIAVLALVAIAALALAWNTQQRTQQLEAELVRRQQDSANLVTETRGVAREAAELARDAAARVALLDARLAETTLQRSQLEELIQTLARSRDDGVLVEIEATLRMAMQQAAITGSVEPLIAALTQAEERLARSTLPRLERVRRALAQDLERARDAGGADPALLGLRLDDAIRQVDELPLLAEARRGRDRAGGPGDPQGHTGVDGAVLAGESAGPTGASPAAGSDGRLGGLRDGWARIAGAVRDEARGLIRVTRVDDPETLLLAPDQAYFLRENLKLRLLNARVALLSRQFDAAQSDLRDAQRVLERYFDSDSRRVVLVREHVREVMAQARAVGVPRPDATLAAIATATAGR